MKSQKPWKGLNSFWFAFILFFCLGMGSSFAQTEFIIEVDLSIPSTKTNGHAADTITIPVRDYNFDIDWDYDGTFEAANSTTANLDVTPLSAQATHIYPAGTTTKQIAIRPHSGTALRFAFDNNYDAEKVTGIVNWGTTVWDGTYRMFRGCENLATMPNSAGIPNLSNTTAMDYMFAGCNVFQPGTDIGNWNVSNVINFRNMFYNCQAFNRNLNNWDVDRGINFYGMFRGCTVFNSPLNNWNINPSGAAVNLGYMFASARAFVGAGLDQWEDFPNSTIGNVTHLDAMFRDCDQFNTDIGNWKVGQVRHFQSMFQFADIFNQDLSSWTIGYIDGTTLNPVLPGNNWRINMSAMFDGTAFNQDLSAWERDNGPGDRSTMAWVDNMSVMFKNADFNHANGIGNWDVGRVANFRYMFENNSKYNNPDIANWNIGQNTGTATINMQGMFLRNSLFNHPLNSWERSGTPGVVGATGPSTLAYVNDMRDMFESNTAYNQPIGDWQVGRVRYFDEMFRNNTAFNNSSLMHWNIGVLPDGNTQYGQPITMSGMFRNAAFNQALTNWERTSSGNQSTLEHVTSLAYMFHDNSNFDQTLSNWNVSSVTNFTSMFQNASAFDQNLADWTPISGTNFTDFLDGSGLTIDQYDALLISWANQSLQNNAVFGAQGLEYCNGIDARQRLIDTFSWDLSSSGDILTANCSLPGLVGGINVWLNADNITGASDNTAFATWDNLITSTGSASSPTQGTLANQPIYHDGEAGLYNFNAYVDFDGTDDLLPFSDLSLTDYAAYIVGNIDVDNSGLFNPPGNGAHQFYVTSLDNSIRFANAGVVNYMVTPANSVQTDTDHIFSVYYNPAASVGNENSISLDGNILVSNTNTGSTLAQNTGLGAGLDGQLSEIIFIDNASYKSPTERTKIESYLALKYGITLANGSKNYLASDATSYWSNSTATTGTDSYINDIIGLGRDEASALHQKVSHSVNTSAILSVATNDDFTNANSNGTRTDISPEATVADTRKYITFAHNGGAETTNAGNTELGTGMLAPRIDREWQVQKLNWTNDITLNFGAAHAGMALYMSNLETFNTGTVEELGVLDTNGTISVANADLDANSYLTLATPISPGGVVGANLWVKANVGVSSTGSTVTDWIDQTAYNSFTINGAPQTGITLFNFNNSIDFDGSDYFEGNSEISYQELFGVFRLADATTINGVVLGTNNTTPGSEGYFWGNVETNDRLTTGDYNPVGSDDFFYSHVLGEEILLYNDNLDANMANVFRRLNGADQTLTNQFFGGGPSVDPVTNLRPYIGRRDGGSFLNGSIGEILVYPSTVGPTQRQKIQSYLAIKYGISIDQGGAGQDYLASNGTTEMWDYSEATTGFTNNIFGIGKDSASDLEQNISKSVNADAIITLAHGDVADFDAANTHGSRTPTADMSFQTIAHNGVGSGTWEAFNAATTPTDYQILDRQWQVQEHDASDNDAVAGVTLAFNVADTGASFDVADLIQGTEYYLLIDTNNNGNYTDDGQSPVALTQQGNIWYTETPINLVHQSRFTLATSTLCTGNLSYTAPNYDLSSFSGSYTLPSAASNPLGTAMFNAKAITFNKEGTRAFILDRDIDIVAFDLATPFDLQTAVLNASASSPNQTWINSHLGIAFNFDGSKVFINHDNVLEQYNITDYDVSGVNANLTPDASYTMVTNAGRFVFSPDGMSFFSLTGGASSSIARYTLTAPFDISAPTQDQTWTIGPGFASGAASFMFNYGGTKLYIKNNGDRDVYEFDLATPFDLTQITEEGISYDFFSTPGAAISVSPTGEYFYEVSGAIDAVKQSAISNPATYTESKLTYDGAINNVEKTVIYLQGDQFNDLGSGVLTPAQVTVGNVSAGLTAVLTITDIYGETDNALELTFTGTATDHDPADSITDLTFTFTNTAFSCASASNITNSGSGAAYSPNIGISFLDKPISPGGVVGANIWLKADADVYEDLGTDVAEDGDAVEQWNSSSNSEVLTGTGHTPQFNTSDINFNPSVLFAAGQMLDMPAGYSNADAIVYLVSHPDPASPAKVLFSANPNTAHAFFNTGNQFVSFLNGSVTNSLVTVPNAPHLFFMDNDGGTSQDLSVNSRTLSTYGLVLDDDIEGFGNNITMAPGLTHQYGTISEFVYFKVNDHTPLQRQQVESYLALKYGITLDQSTGQDYLASDGTTEMWDYSEATTGFTNNIFGIGKDSGSDLEQNISKSVNADAIITLAHGDVDDFDAANTDGTRTPTADMSFQTIAHNGLGNGSWEAFNAATTPTDYQILDRQWQVQEHDATDNDAVAGVTLAFDVADTGAGFNVADPLAGNTTYYMAYDANGDGDFLDTGSGDTLIELTQQGDIWYTETPIDLVHQSRFTLATYSVPPPSPGGVLGASLWLKADDGVSHTGDGTNTTAWLDRSGADYDFSDVGTLPYLYRESGINYNPSIDNPDKGDRRLQNTNSITLQTVHLVLFPTDLASLGCGNPFSESGIDDSGIRPCGVGPAWHIPGNSSDFTDGNPLSKGWLNGQIVNDPLVPAEPQILTLESAVADIIANGIEIGDSNHGRRWLGHISEIIGYNGTHSVNQLKNVESYLALKYGITLNQSAEQDYFASDWNGTTGTKMWDATGTNTSGFNNDIFGIGRDDASALEQRISKSVNQDAIITLATDDADFTAANTTHAALGSDLMFQTIANNGNTNLCWTSNNSPTISAQDYAITPRQWQVQEKGTAVGNVYIAVDVDDAEFDLPALLSGTHYYLIIDSDGDFSDATIAHQLTQVGATSTWTSPAIDFNDGDYFAIATQGDVSIVATTNDAVVVLGTTTEAISPTVTQGTPTLYTIDYDAAAEAEGFADITTPTALAGANYTIPANPTLGSYNGTMIFYDATQCNTVSDTFTITVNSPFNPGGVLGASLWLKANDGVTASPTLTQWEDKSGNNNSPNNYTKAPDWIDSGTGLANFNPLVRFDGANTEYLEWGTSIVDGFTNAELFVVPKRIHPNNGALFDFEASTGGGNAHYGLSSHRDLYESFGRTNRGYLRTENHIVGADFSGLTVNPQAPDLSLDVYNVYQISVAPADYNLYFNGTRFITDDTFTIDFQNSSGTNSFGQKNSRYFNGEIPELILFDKILLGDEKLRVNSYLSLKYGITLDQNSLEQSYVASDWNGTTGTKIWDATGTNASGFNNDIFGIGRDDASALEQRISKSVNTDAIITLSTDDTDFTAANTTHTALGSDLMFQTIANNGNTNTCWTSTNAPTISAQPYAISQRLWQVQEKGTAVGNVYIAVDVDDAEFDLPVIISGTHYYLIIDNDGDFSDATIAHQLTQVGATSTWTSPAIDFNDGDYFAIATQGDLNLVATANDATVILGTTTEAITPTITQGSVSLYTIDYDAAAQAQGFTDITTPTALAGANYTIPANPAVGTYNGTITFYDAAECNSVTDTFTITILGVSVASTGTEITASPTIITADGSSTSTITLQLKDVSGNDLALAGVEVQFAMASGTGTLSNTGIIQTNASGQATVTLTSPNLVGSGVVTAQVDTNDDDTVDGEVHTDNRPTVTYVAGPIAVNGTGTEISAADGAATADGTETETITVLLRDASGNVINQAGVGVTFNVTGSAVLSSATATTDASGVATITLTNTIEETVDVTATVDHDANGATAELAIVNGSPAQVAFSNAPIDVTGSGTEISATDGAATADGTETETITVQLRDASGNVINQAGVGVTFNVTGSAVLSSATATTNASGVATVTVTNTIEETVDVTATVDHDANGATAELAIVNGSPAQVAFSNAPIDVTGSGTEISAADGAATADGTETETITVQLRDASGNVINQAGVGVSFNVTGSAVLSSATATTDASGVATITVTNTIEETVDVTATVDHDANGATAELAIVNGSPAQIVFSNAPIDVTGSGTEISAADGAATADGTETETITVQLRDASGNVINQAGVGVTFNVTGSAVLSSATATTNASGVATITVTNTIEETVDVTATVDHDTNGATAELAIVNGSPAQVAFSNAPIDVTGSGTEISAADGAATADGTETETITVQLRDASGNVINQAGVGVTFNVTGSAVLSSATATTNASGVATITVTNTIEETVDVTATVDHDANGATAELAIVNGSPAQVAFSNAPIDVTGSGTEISAADGAATADGNETETITVQLRDASGNVINQAGVGVTFNVTGSAVLSSATATTDTSGVATITVTNTIEETVDVTATVDHDANGATAELAIVNGSPAQVAFSNAPIDVTGSGTEISAADGAATADGTETETITVQLRDASGNVINQAGVDVTFNVTGSAVLSSATATTDASGVATITVTNTIEETVDVTATVDHDANGATAELAIVNGSPGQVAFSNAPIDVTGSGTEISAADGAATADGSETETITVQLRDASGNVINQAGVGVSFNVTGSAVLSSATTTTDASGVATITVTNTVAETVDMTATVDHDNNGATAELAIVNGSPASINFVPGSLNASASTIVTTANNAIADGTATNTVTVTIRDVNANPIPNIAVIVALTGTGSAVVGTIAPNTDMNGEISIDMTNILPENLTVGFTVNAVASVDNTSVLFDPHPILVAIGVDGNNGNNANTSTLTAAQLNSLPTTNGAIPANEAAYLEAIAANEGPFSSPATEAEVQAMIDRVNAAESLLANIGIDATNGNNANTSTVTAAELNALTGVSGAISGNEAAYREAIAANEGPFSSPATEAEVQAMIDRVNAAESLLANIGIDATNGNNANTSTVTAAELNALTGVSGAIPGNEAAYREAIAANEGPFSSPATEAEVQAMIDRVNAAESLLANIGIDATNGNNANTSSVTAAELNALTGVSGAIPGNEAAYREAIAANEGPFSSPATETEVQAMIDRVNAAESLLANIGIDATNGNNANTSSVTAAELNALTGVSGAIPGNEAAYREAIAANEGPFSSPATETEVQAMIDRVNAAESLLANIGIDATNGNNANTSSVTAAELNALTGVSGAIPGNEAAYREAIAANEGPFSSPATEAEVQAMIDRVNAAESLLANIGIDASNGNNANTSTVTAAELNALTGVSSAIAGNEAAYLEAIAANEGPFSSPATEAEVQAMIDRVNAAESLLANIGIDASNGNNANTSTVTAAELNGLTGVSGAIAANEAAYLEAIAANEGPFSSPATEAEVQAIIDRVNAAESLLANIGIDASNGNNANTSSVTAAELNGLTGVSGAIAANEAAYLEAIAANEGPFSSPATEAEVQAMIDRVNAAESLLANIGIDANNGNNANTSAVTAAELNGLTGVSGAIAANEAAYLEAIAANEGPFSSPATEAEVQAMIDRVNAAESLLANIGIDASNGNNANTSTVTAAELNGLTGVSGAIAGNEAAYREAIAANEGPFSSPATEAEVQAMIDRVNAAESLLANIGIDASNGNNANTSAVTAAELNGLTGVSGAIAANEAAYLEAIAANEGPFSSPATEAEVQAMIDRVNAAESLLVNIGIDATNGNNANTSAVTAAELNGLTGVSGAIAGNEAAYLEAIAANEGPFSSPATEAEVQDMIDRVNAAESLLANIGIDASNGNNANTSTVTAAELNGLTGVSGAIAANEAAYLEAIAANEGPFSSPATEAEVQAMIDRVNAAESLLANIGIDASNGNNANTSAVTAAELNGLTGVSGAIAGNEAAYLEAIAANEGPFSSPATEAEVQAMIDLVNAAESLLANIGIDASNGNNANTSAVTAAELNGLTGVSGAIAGNEAAYLEAIAANEGPFSSPATEAEVQAMIDRVNAAESLLANIGIDASNGNNANTSAVTAAELNGLTGVSGAIAANEAAYLEAIAANEGPFSSPATEAEVQAMIDRVNAAESLLANIGIDASNGNNANTSAVTAAELNGLTGVSGAIAANEAAYLEAIAANEGPFSSPATEAEVQAMIDRVNAAESLLANIGIDASNGNNANTSAVTAAELNGLTGVSGAIAGNEAAYLEAIAANEGPFSSPATEAEVQDMIDRVNAAESLLANIGIDASNGNNANTSAVTAAELNGLTGVSGAIAGNEAAYLEAIAANEGPFSSPATEAEVQNMVDMVNQIAEIVANSNDPADGNPSITDLGNAGATNLVPSNEGAYEEAIASASPAPSTLSQLQEIIDSVNASQAAIAEVLEDSNSTGGAQNANGTAVTVEQLQRIDGLTGVMPQHEAAYQTLIQLETGFSNPPTVSEIQTIIDAVNAHANDYDGDGIANAEDPDELDPCNPMPAYDNIAFDVTNPIWQQADCDGDGITNAQEIIDGRNPFCNENDLTADCDGDGLTNAEEDANGDGDLTNDDLNGNGIPDYVDALDTNADADGDGVSNEFEDLNGDGNPDNDDTDGDGIPNYLDSDDDGDGHPTQDEFADPNGDGNPDDAFDADGDGTPDYLEFNNADAEAEDNIEVYNGLTPDGNSENDVFVIRGIEQYENTVQIYNRWGQKVFETQNYGSQGNFFEGIATQGSTLGSDPLPEGTYFYAINYVVDGINRLRTGYLFIQR
ncbi:Ig-like domain-containing protein [Sediminicola luteus]|nr:invasin domain 3-containing protein [Sediminicola luteus]